MNSVVIQQADQARKDAMASILANKRIRHPTRIGIEKIDEACRRIIGTKGGLTVSNVVRVLEQLYPGNHPAEQSIRNKSAAGDAYREVIAAWKTYEMAVGRATKINMPLTSTDDLSDTLLQQIEPESARLIVLSMRTTLRNMRRQFQTLQMVSSDKLVRHSNLTPTNAPARQINDDLVTLGSEEIEAFKTFIDTAEMSARDLEWDDLGRLLSSSTGEVFSRPRLREALEKLGRLVL